MKRYLILGWAAMHLVAGAAPAAARPAPPPVAKPATAPPRHLSDAQRAELRQQLLDFDRRTRKHQ